MKIISYKYFSNQFDFEKWQKEHNPEIIGVTPTYSGSGIQHINDYSEKYAVATSSDIVHDHMVFVTFYKEGSL